jgi:hypothetical protein
MRSMAVRWNLPYRYRLTVCLLMALALPLACRRREGTKVAAPQGTPVPTQAVRAKERAEILIHLRGVVGLMNPLAPNGTIVKAVIPKNSSDKPARDDDRVSIPKHYAFVRFVIGPSYQESSSTRKPDFRFIHRDAGKPDREIGVVLLRVGEKLSLDGAASNPAGTLLYDHFSLDEDPLEPNLNGKKGEETAFHWVTKLNRVCRKEKYLDPDGQDLQRLIDIQQGVLSALPPKAIWEFEPTKEFGRTYRQALAEGVVWRLTPTPGSQTFTLTGTSENGIMTFGISGEPVEIGNYPLEDILFLADHHPMKDYIDRHFELYEQFFKTKHIGGEKLHVPKYVGELSGIHAKSTGGPSCGPGHLP